MSLRLRSSEESNFRRRHSERVKNVSNRLRKQCTPRGILKLISSFIPIFKWLPEYDWNECFFHDMSGGLSMAVLAVPTGIAHAGIAGVEPVYGLYTAIFPAFLYMIFGNSRYTALGGFALLSLMTRGAINKVMINTAIKYNATHFINETAYFLNETIDYLNADDFELFQIDSINNNFTGFREIITEEWTDGYKQVRPIHIATTLMFLSGILHILMGIFRLDFISSYFSEQIMSGFIVGGSIHVFFAQIADTIGIELPKRAGKGYLYFRICDLISMLNEIHIPTLIISLSSVSFLLFSQFFMQPRLSNIFDFPIPYELILVVVAITATNFADLSTHHSIKVVGNIPTDFPPPALPRFDLIPSIFLDSCSIALTAVAIHLTIAVIIKQRYHYNFDNCRELYSLGFVGIFSSFFPVFPVTSVFARSVVGTATHSTQMTVCFSSVALLAVVLYIGPALEYLPKCVLASMVIVSLYGSLMKIKEAKNLWPTFKCDLLIFIMSAILTICLDLSDGLISSVFFAAFTIIVRSQSPRWHILTRSDDIRDFRETNKKELDFVQGNICVFRFDAPLMYTSVGRFIKIVREVIKKWEKRDSNTLHTDEMGFRWRVRGLRAILVIDCSGFSYVDHLGLNTLIRIYRDLEADGVITKFAAPKAQLKRVFQSTDFFEKIPQEAVFDSVAIAVHVCERHYAAVKTIRQRCE